MGKNIVILVLALLAIGCLVQWFNIRIRAAFAEEQTQYFEEALRKGASTTTQSEVDTLIEAVRIYYPSGSKQISGSHLDRMVERGRRLAIEQLQRRKSELRSPH